jgi:cell division protein DivIC
MAMNVPNPLQVITKKLPKPLRNKYFLSIAVFAAVMILFDKHDLLTQWKLRGSVKRLEYDKTYYEQRLEQAKIDQDNINNNKEQFAREKYHMHKSDEDVFIIEEK